MRRSVIAPAFLALELLSRLELPNLFLTKEVLYQLSYNSMSIIMIDLFMLLYLFLDVNALAVDFSVRIQLSYCTAKHALHMFRLFITHSILSQLSFVSSLIKGTAHFNTQQKKRAVFTALRINFHKSAASTTSYRYAFCPLCLMISYINMAAALLAFSELILPDIGIDTVKSHFSFTSLLIPLPSLPMTIAIGPLRSASV